MNKLYENFIFNNGRDLEVSLFNHYFIEEDIDTCLMALSLYLNEDGGISNIDPDNLNNVSTLASCIYLLNILVSLNYDFKIEYFNEIIDDLIKFIKKQKEFTYFHKSNKNKPCHNKFKTNEYSLELEAITYCYISYFSQDTTYINRLNDLIDKYLLLNDPTDNQIYYFKIIESLFNNDILKNKIILDVKNNFSNVEKLIFSNDDYLLEYFNDDLIKYKNSLENNKNHLGVWERNNSWGNNLPEEEVCNIKYLSITLITNLLFIKRVEEYDKNN